VPGLAKVERFINGREGAGLERRRRVGKYTEGEWGGREGERGRVKEGAVQYRTGLLLAQLLSLRTISAFLSGGICSMIFSGILGDLAAISFAF